MAGGAELALFAAGDGAAVWVAAGVVAVLVFEAFEFEVVTFTLVFAGPPQAAASEISERADRARMFFIIFCVSILLVGF